MIFMAMGDMRVQSINAPRTLKSSPSNLLTNVPSTIVILDVASFRSSSVPDGD
jgi:hypothetical protein